jgi:glucose-1-phosphate adenylyltransferase
MGTPELLRDVLTIILAGGQGERLYPLTRDRAKPAVPFGGIYRIIDFTLSNCLNSGCGRIYVLTQYKSFSLDRHLILGWSPVFNHPERGSYLHILPPQMRTGDERWYVGTADAIHQNIYTLERERPQRVLLLAGDHIYKMDYSKMIEFHAARKALLTVACVPVEKQAASQLGIAVVDANSRIGGFKEKPKEDPPTIPGDPNRCLASMGIYIFETEELVRRVTRDARRESSHDFGKDIIPEMVSEGAAVYAWPFEDENRKGGNYWRDVGAIDSYYEANMDLIKPEPVFNLYDTHWPVHTYIEQAPPAKFVHNVPGPRARRGQALDSIVAPGAVVSGGTVERCVLSPQVRVNSFSQVLDSILMEGVQIGRYAKVRRAILDKGVHVPEGVSIGYDAAADGKHFTISPNGLVVVPKETPADVLQSADNSAR